MTLSDLIKFYHLYGWRDFYGRVARRLTDWCVPQLSYAQAGEDAIIDFLFEGVNIYRPTYLDLGTNHPRMGNNTYKFYRKGGHGVLVEADPSLFLPIKRLRSRDTVLNVGVGKGDARSAAFFVFDLAAINTFDEREAQLRQQEGLRLKEVVEVPLKTVNELIAEHFTKTPDFLSVDVEGLDLAIMKTLDIQKYPVPVICVETCLYSTTHIKGRDTSIIQFMESIGYFVYADTFINTIFVNKNWFETVAKK
jgi:FkbM family methyltransferase